MFVVVLVWSCGGLILVEDCVFVWLKGKLSSLDFILLILFWRLFFFVCLICMVLFSLLILKGGILLN